jgi:hypothetical protein
MVSARAGRSTLGCLVVLLLVSAAAYFGVNVAEAYWRYYRYQDAFRQQARFARQNGDAVILARLHALADSLGLPDEAHRIRVRRGAGRFTVSAEYVERVEMPLVVREFRFNPSAEGPL